jgi:hypothetical protein
MKRPLVLTLCIVFTLVALACLPSLQPEPTPTPMPTATATAIPSPTPTATATLTPSPTFTPQPTPTITPIPNLMLENGSGELVCDVFISPSASDFWGEDLLYEGEAILENAQRGFSLEENVYDVLVQDCRGNAVDIWWQVDVGDELATLTVGPRPGVAGRITVTLANDSGIPICSVFISPSTEEYWGVDWLDATEAIRVNRSRTFRLSPGTYDMLAEDCDFEEIDSAWGITITDEYTWHVGGVDEGPSAPSGGAPAPSTGSGNGYIYVLSEIPVGGTCRISVWGNGLELLLDAGVGGTPASYEVPPGGYGWQAFLGWGQTDADAITVAPGGSCSFTCYREGTLDYVRWGCNP